MAGRDELCENSNPLQGLKFDAQHCETRNYILEAELKMDASQTVDCCLFDNVDNITFTFFQ